MSFIHVSERLKRDTVVYNIYYTHSAKCVCSKNILATGNEKWEHTMLDGSRHRSEARHVVVLIVRAVYKLCPPVCILTLCSLEVNWSLTVNTWPLSISFDFGSLVRTLCVGFPQAKDCSARTNSRSGISVSCWISFGRGRNRWRGCKGER